MNSKKATPAKKKTAAATKSSAKQTTLSFAPAAGRSSRAAATKARGKITQVVSFETLLSFDSAEFCPFIG